jgi:hypothetical protein
MSFRVLSGENPRFRKKNEELYEILQAIYLGHRIYISQASSEPTGFFYSLLIISELGGLFGDFGVISGERFFAKGCNM